MIEIAKIKGGTVKDFTFRFPTTIEQIKTISIKKLNCVQLCIVFFFLSISFFISLQWSVSGVFSVPARLTADAEPQPGHPER